MPKSDPPSRPSNMVQLVTAAVVALGIGGGGGSLIAAGYSTEALDSMLAERSKVAEMVFATKLELAEMGTEIQLIRQALMTANGALATMGAQLTSIEESMRDNHSRRR